MKSYVESPFLKSVRLEDEAHDKSDFPFNVPAFKHGINIQLTTPVTFIVGSNGAGKSTLLEAIADKCGFNLAGGNRNHHYDHVDTVSELSDSLRLSWSPKVTTGFFMRAETYFNFASYLNASDLLWNEEGNSIHDQSHGQSFLALFKNRFKTGLYILDEPESALSASSQLAFLSIINTLEKSGDVQFIISTHSPILICYPKSRVLALSNEGINEINYYDTEQYQLTKGFLESPDRYFKHLFSET